MYICLWWGLCTVPILCVNNVSCLMAIISMYGWWHQTKHRFQVHNCSGYSCSLDWTLQDFFLIRLLQNQESRQIMVRGERKERGQLYPLQPLGRTFVGTVVVISWYQITTLVMVHIAKRWSWWRDLRRRVMYDFSGYQSCDWLVLEDDNDEHCYTARLTWD